MRSVIVHSAYLPSFMKSMHNSYSPTWPASSFTLKPNYAR